MPIDIHITGDTAGEALKELSTFANGLTGNSPVTAVAEKVAEPEKSKRTRGKPQEEKPTEPEPEQEAEPVIDESEPVDGDEGADDEPAPTEVEIRAAITAAQSRAEDKIKVKQAVKDLLNKYGSPNVSGIPEGKRAAFKREVEAL